MLTFLILILAYMAQGQPVNMIFLSNIPYPQGTNDVWGYVDDDGTEYAIVGTWTGVAIVSLADPANPVEVAFIPGPVSLWRDMKTWGHYAYASNETDLGLLIIDLSGLPNTVTHKDTIIGGISRIHNLWIDEAGYLYASGGGPFVFNGGIAIFDLTDPWRPNLAGAYDGTYVHDVYVRDGLAYAAEIYDGQLTILDVSDRTTPTLIGLQSYPGGFTHNTWLNDAGTVCFTTDEVGGSYIHAWDITDPTDIKLLDRIRSEHSGGTTVPHNVHVLDDYLVVSYYRDGIVVYDASRPDRMVEVAHYDTSPFSGDGFNGSWGAYPFLPSGLVLASDMEEGLFVLQPTYQRGCYLDGTVRDSVTGAVLDGITVVIDTLATVQTDADGRFSFETAQTGTYTITVSAYGYEPKSQTFVLSPDSLLELDVLLKPWPRSDLTITVLDTTDGSPLKDAQVRLSHLTDVFGLLTDADGNARNGYFIANTYEVIVGKWGYRTEVRTRSIPAGSFSDTVYLSRGYYDDFALDFGWFAGGDASTGIWERAVPLATQYTFGQVNPGADLPDDIGPYAYVTGNGGGPASSNDVDSGQTVLRAPVMDLSGYRKPMLRFWWWFVNFNTATSGRGDDVLRVELSGNGVNYLPVAIFDDSIANSWHLADSISVGDYLGLLSQVYFRVITSDLGEQGLVEAGIDGFEVFEGDPLRDTTTAIAVLPHGAYVHSRVVADDLELRYHLPAAYFEVPVFADVYSVHGIRVASRQLYQPTDALRIPMAHTAAGVYIVRLRGHFAPIQQKFIR
ncbi:MAG: hypothetical protein OHK0039_11250 [Bacteroidia bacterium]